MKRGSTAHPPERAVEAYTGLVSVLGPNDREGSVLVFDLSEVGVPLADDRMVTPFVVEAPLAEPIASALPANFERAAIGSGRETSRCPVTIQR